MSSFTASRVCHQEAADHMEWTVRLIQGVDRLGEQHVHVAHTFFGAQYVRKNCAEGGVSKFACFLSQLTQCTVTA